MKEATLKHVARQKKAKLPPLSSVKKALMQDWARRVKERDGWGCMLCGSTDNVTAHHWFVANHFANQARYMVDNGITLCYACHIRKVHTRADYVTIGRLKHLMSVNHGFTDKQEESLISASNTPVTTQFLRDSWDVFRKPIKVNPLPTDTKWKVIKKRLFITPGLYDCVSQHQTFVVGNVVCFSGCDVATFGYPLEVIEEPLFEVTAVATVASNHDRRYRYTLQPVVRV